MIVVMLDWWKITTPPTRTHQQKHYTGDAAHQHQSSAGPRHAQEPFAVFRRHVGLAAVGVDQVHELEAQDRRDDRRDSETDESNLIRQHIYSNLPCLWIVYGWI